MRAAGVTVVLMLALAGCGGLAARPDGVGVAVGHPAGSTVPTTDAGGEQAEYDEAPPVTVTSGATTLTLPPWTVCWSADGGGYCADGAPAENPPDLGTVTDAVVVEFPVDGWSFSAALRDPDDPCGVSLPIQLEPAGARSWTLPPTGPAGAYEVDVDGLGSEGDVHATFSMVTTTDGPMPAPVARLALVYDVDGVPQLYDPPTLGLTMLPEPGEPITASIEVSAADGHRTQLRLEPAAQQCRTVGSVALSVGGALEAQSSDLVPAAAELGPAPYDITVVLDLRGVTHTAHVSYPEDQLPQSLELPAAFSPPIPTAAAAAYAPFLTP